MTEFAVVLPLLVTIIFAIIEMGFMFYQTLTVSQGARIAARRGAIGAGAAEIRATIKGFCSGLGIRDQDISITVKNKSGVTQSGEELRSPGFTLQVRVTYQIKFLTFLSGVISGPVTIQPSTQIQVE